MNHAWLLTTVEMKENFRARWYQLYALALVFLISGFFYFGLAESRALGFTGLGRLLLTLIQISIIILPIFTMMSGARSMVGDRESGVWEYNLSIPVKLSSFYWGRALGKFLSLFLPLALGLSFIGAVTALQGYETPWKIVFLYTSFLGGNLLCFSGMALCLSVYAKNQEMALGGAFILWLLFEAMIDVLLLGLMLKHQISATGILGVAFLNPLQSFRMAAIALFDPQLTALGPIAYTIIEKAGINFLIFWAAFWPALLGLFLAGIGFVGFKKRDLI